MRQTIFQGVIPKMRTEKLPANFANNAENCLLHSGAIVPLKSLREHGCAVDVMGNRLSTPPESLYRVGDVELGFSRFTPIAEDPLHIGDNASFLFVQDGKLLRSSPHWITDKLGPVQLGIDEPCAAPALAVVTEGDCNGFGFETDCFAPPYGGKTDCATQLPPQVLSFCHTWVTACGEESAPSPYAEPVLVQRGELVLISAVSAPPANAVEVRWYMAVANKENALMLFVGSSQLPEETTFLLCPDEFAGEEALPSEGWMPMRCGEGVASFGVKSVIVWSGEYLYPSVPGQPHAFMERDRIKIDWPVVRVVSYINAAGLHSVVVLTKGQTYTITRDDDDKPPVVRLVSRMMPCIDPRAVLVVGEVVYYTSTEGLVMLTGNTARTITSRWFDTKAWHEIGLHHYILGYYDQRIFMLATSDQARSFMFPALTDDNPYEKQDVVYLTHRASALYTDADGEMVVTGIGKTAATWLWEQGDINMLATWECKTITQAGYTHYNAAKVLTDSIRTRPEAEPWVAMLQERLHRKPTAHEAKDFVRCHPEVAEYINDLVGGFTRFTLIVRKVPVFSRHVWGESPFRLPRNQRAAEWGFSISTTEPVYEVHVAQSFNNLVHEGGAE